MTVKPMVARERLGRGPLVDAVKACASIADKCVMSSPGKSSLRLGRGCALGALSSITEVRELEGRGW